MGRYERVSNRGSYSNEKLKEAVQHVKSGKMSGYNASKIYQIPRMTIMDHVKNRRGKSATLGRNKAISPDIEYKLATSLHLMEKNGFGLSRAEVIEMVREYVIRNDLDTPFKNSTPGKDWFLAFKKRHGLSVKKPQAVEYARKRVMDPFIIYPYFTLLEKTINDLNLTYKPSCIWNLDETSFSKDPSKTKIVGAKGYAATRIISSAGRDNTTVLLGASASGEKTPPLIIYKGKNVWDTWTSSEAYPGTSYAATKNGWMETEVFESFFKKSFLPTVQDRRPVLLIYDGHSTHVGLHIIEEARKENITIIKLPPHSSHILQPLDIAVMKPFKDRWDALLVKWQRLNVGSVMPKNEFAKLIGQIWTEIDPQVLRNGFRKAGIYPVNRNQINESQFDSLKLRHWREYENKRNGNDDIMKNNPKSLLVIALNLYNKTDLHENPEDLQGIYIHNKPLESRTRDHNITFEELLLQKVRRVDSSPKPRRRKVASGAEVITHYDVLERKQEEQRKQAKIYTNKKLRNSKDTQSPKTFNNVVYLKNVPKNDCQMLPFAVKDLKYLPSCFQRNKSDSPKINIISNILIKSPDTEKEDDTTAQKYTTTKLTIPGKENKILHSKKIQSRKYTKLVKKQTDNKVLNTRFSHATVLYDKRSSTQKDKTFDSTNLYENPKSGSSGLCKSKYRRCSSSSTTSVTGSISSYGDSDIEDIVSDSPTLIDNDEENKSNTLPQTANIENDSVNDLTSDIDNDNKKHKVCMYDSGDNVLVRYHVRQKWTYYVGQIESVKIMEEEPFYTIRFYKTFKKPELTFKMTKKIDRDDVPEILIVKKVNLTQNPKTLSYFFVDDDNLIYF